MIDYSPTTFLRCHSRNKGDVADKRTGVWHCAFEPAHQESSNSMFASCGGNSVCVINAENASVKTKHYSKDYNENFHSVAWTTLMTLNGRIRILAVAGLKSVLHLLHPDGAICFAEHNLLKTEALGSKKKLKDPIECLIFHPGQPNILFGGFTSGVVHVWDIGNPYPSLYNCRLEKLKTMNTRHSAYALTFSSHCNMLLCATKVGAVGWITPAAALRSNEKFRQRTFHFTSTNETMPREDKDFVDSIEAIGGGRLIASKCALHGYIYIWDLEEAVENQVRVVKPVHKLKWSNTDNFYMNIGISGGGDILACGDDLGNLWVYNIEEITFSRRDHHSSNVISWPEVQDSLTERQKKLPFNKSGIVVNKVALNYDAKYLVAVTNTNTVCIWKRDA